MTPSLKHVKAEEIEVYGWSSDKAEQSPWNMPRGVRVVHVPSGVETKCEKHRYQHANKDEALLELDDALAELSKAHD